MILSQLILTNINISLFLAPLFQDIPNYKQITDPLQIKPSQISLNTSPQIILTYIIRQLSAASTNKNIHLNYAPFIDPSFYEKILSLFATYHNIKSIGRTFSKQFDIDLIPKSMTYVTFKNNTLSRFIFGDASLGIPQPQFILLYWTYCIFMIDYDIIEEYIMTMKLCYRCRRL